MNPNFSRAYSQSTIKAATPGQLVIMLYDGLIRFATEAKENMKDSKSCAHAIDRCVRIITELNISLKYDASPELCGQLSGLYEFYVLKFSEAMQKNDAALIDQLIPMITSLRDAWSEAEAQIAQRAG
jgi:flagellar secretion chaperone FliS